MSSLKEKAEAGIDSAYPHETREQWKSRIFNHVLRLTADDIERIGIATISTQEGYSHILQIYIRGAQGEHAYIVEYLRGLLKEEA